MIKILGLKLFSVCGVLLDVMIWGVLVQRVGDV